MVELIVPIVMCGGAGTRLWPASRENRPKQFLPLFGQQSTFQQTIARVSDPKLFAKPVIITNALYRFLVADQLSEIGIEADILLEPERRDSGPAIAAGAAYAIARGDDSIVVALAADHLVTDVEGFVAACAKAAAVARKGWIVTFGVHPDRPATEYGYIHQGSELGDGAYSVATFVEKPDLDTARRYVADGYLWNSGNFVFRASTLLEEYSRFDTETSNAVRAAVAAAGNDIGFVTLDREAFSNARPDSFDYAVMEKTERAAVVPAAFGWSDVGSWHAVWELSERDSEGNAFRGSAAFLESRGSYVASEKALVALFGVENLVVVASEDAVLVANRDDTNGIKRLVQELKRTAPAVTVDHIRSHRPWGDYQLLDNGARYQVKRIVVKKGARLSLQYHNHRAEHWVVVRGTAKVTIGDQVKTLHENESIYIPIGTMHRLENPGKIDLELIEVQTGSYLGEDDIVRVEDDYRRS